MSVIREAGGTGDPQSGLGQTVLNRPGFVNTPAKRRNSCRPGKLARQWRAWLGQPWGSDEIYLKPGSSVASRTDVPYNYPYC
jgi:hypothetical protein